jgi:hypothetical protein
VLASILPDLDYAFSASHRDLMTHTPIFWTIVLAPLYFLNWIFGLMLLAIYIHFALDLIDWGVMIFFPLSKKKFGLKLLPLPKLSSLRGWEQRAAYAEIYVRNRIMVTLEIMLLILSVVLLSILRY